MKYVKIGLICIACSVSIGVIARKKPNLKRQLFAVFDKDSLLPRFKRNIEISYQNDPARIIEFLQTRDDGQWNMLHHYVSHDRVQGVQSVFEYLEKLYKAQSTPKMKEEIFKFINARDDEGRSILHIALLRQNYAVAKKVMRFFEDMYGNDSDKVEQFLLISDNFGWTPLHVSTFNDDFKNTRMLLKRGQRLMTAEQFDRYINAPDNEGDKPYDYAKPAGRKLLAEYGAEITEPSEQRTGA